MDRLGLYDSDALPQFSYEFIWIARTVGLGLCSSDVIVSQREGFENISLCCCFNDDQVFMNKLFISNQTHNPICKKSGKKQFCCCDDIMRFFHVIILSRNIGRPEWLLNWKESRKMNNWVTKWCNLKPNGRKHACYVSKEPTLHTPFSKSSLWPPFTFVLRSCPRKWRRRDYKWCFTISAPPPSPSVCATHSAHFFCRLRFDYIFLMITTTEVEPRRDCWPAAWVWQMESGS